MPGTGGILSQNSSNLEAIPCHLLSPESKWGRERHVVSYMRPQVSGLSSCHLCLYNGHYKGAAET